MPKELCGTLYRNGPNPQFAPRGPLPLVRRRRHDPRLPRRERQRLLPEPLGAHAEMGAGERGRRGRCSAPSAIRCTPIPRVMERELDHRQHQHRLARRQAAGARGGARALRARSGDLTPVQTRGYETWGDKLRGPFTAHPKLDPETGEMVFFGYSAATAASPGRSAYSASSADGKITRAEILEAPFPSMIHDFAVTRNWIVRSRPPAHRQPAAGDDAASRRSPGSRTRARTSPSCRATATCGRCQAGSPPRPATSSIR